MNNLSIIKRNNISVEGNLFSHKTILFAHGFGTDQSVWRYIKHSFESEYKLVLFDNTGAGGSAPDFYRKDRYSTLDGYACDLLEIGAALNLDQVIFIGHSVSAMVGLLASLSWPRLFSKMILIGASARYLNDEGYKGGFDQNELNEVYQEIEANFYQWANEFSKVAMANPERPWLREEFNQSLLNLSPEVARDATRSIFQSDFRHILPEINNKVLIIQSAIDVAVPLEAAQYLHRHIRGSQMRVIPAEGHFPHMSAPQEVLSAILEFLGRDEK